MGSKDTANVAVALHNTFLEELERMRDLFWHLYMGMKKSDFEIYRDSSRILHFPYRGTINSFSCVKVMQPVIEIFILVDSFTYYLINVSTYSFFTHSRRLEL